MQFKFSAIDTNNARIEELKIQINELLADNNRMENLQEKALGAIAQLSDVFSQLIGAGIDEVSLNEFRSTVVETVGVDAQDMKEEYNTLGKKLAEASARNTTLQAEKEQLKTAYNTISLKLADALEADKFNIEKIFSLEADLEISHKQRDEYKSNWSKCEAKTVVEEEAIAVEEVVVVEDVPQPEPEAIAVEATPVVEEDEEDALYPLNAVVGAVVRTTSHPEVLILAKNSKMFLGRIVNTEENKKFSPSDIVSYRYTSSRRINLTKKDKQDPNNYFQAGYKVTSKFSNGQEYTVVTSDSIETRITNGVHETVFLTCDLEKVQVPAIELTDREKEIIEQVRGTLAKEEAPKKSSRRKKNQEQVQEVSEPESKVSENWVNRIKNKNQPTDEVA